MHGKGQLGKGWEVHPTVEFNVALRFASNLNERSSKAQGPGGLGDRTWIADGLNCILVVRQPRSSCQSSSWFSVRYLHIVKSSGLREDKLYLRFIADPVPLTSEVRSLDDIT